MPPSASSRITIAQPIVLLCGGANYKLTNRSLNPCYELSCARKAEPKRPKIPWNSIRCLRKPKRHFLYGKCSLVSTIQHPTLARAKKSSHESEVQNPPDHTLPFGRNQDLFMTMGQFLYVFSVTHRCLSCECHRPRGLSPTCRLPSVCRPSASRHNGINR